MADERDRLGLAFTTFFAEPDVPTPTPEKVSVRAAVTETGRGRQKGGQMTLQLCLKAGEVLETATTKVVLGEKRLELGPKELGGVVRHRGWVLTVDPAARSDLARLSVQPLPQCTRRTSVTPSAR